MWREHTGVERRRRTDGKGRGVTLNSILPVFFPSFSFASALTFWVELFKPAGSRATKKKIPPGHIPPPSPISLAPQTHVLYNFPWLFIFSFYRRVPKLARAHFPEEKETRKQKLEKNIIFLSPISSNLFLFSCVIFPASNGNKTDCGLALSLSVCV